MRLGAGQFQRNPRNPAYCETGHNPISGEHLV
jgi:hypothetical protein